MNIIQKNFFAMLRYQISDETLLIEPMSYFKWYKLFQIAKNQNVLETIAQTINHYSKNKTLHIPQDLVTRVKEVLDESDNETNYTKVLFNANGLNEKMKRIASESIRENLGETEQLLYYIAHNALALMQSTAVIDGICIMGTMIKKRSEDINFGKLQTWLEELQLTKIAQLQGSFLIDFLGFNIEEVPFVKKKDKHSLNLMQSLVNTDEAIEWDYNHIAKDYLTENTDSVSKLKDKMKYFNYIPKETLYFLFNTSKNSLKQFEE